MVDYRAIMSLLLQGRSYREVVASVGCSHRDVAAARKAIADRGITAQVLSGMGDLQLREVFPDGRARVETGTRRRTSRGWWRR